MLTFRNLKHGTSTGDASFYRWRKAYNERGEKGLVNAPSIPKWHANRTPPEREEKVLHLRRKYHLGPMRIVWYLERYHDIKMSDATVSRILRRHGMNRLPRGTRMRKVHTKHYQKQVPGHHMQMDVKFLTFIGKKGEKIRRFQYTAIDDATRVRALKVYEKHTQHWAAKAQLPSSGKWLKRALWAEQKRDRSKMSPLMKI